ncbi:hypothetical protein HHL28_07595 [Aerophototrophica crusticola]|uniref:Addiction module toxin RelE n=1 Tax=Aerophototrophica crusticola TaxID=1709002 RepID=A0A858R6D8_9PROT|nr:hypothetical protein HHL28_07595 [Rhodospirillaceae bacterium B3]
MTPRRVRFRPSFLHARKKLTPSQQAAVDTAVQHFINRSNENALRVEYKQGLDCWAFRVNSGWRVFYVLVKEMDGKVSELFHVGPHDDYDTVRAKVPRH